MATGQKGTVRATRGVQRVCGWTSLERQITCKSRWLCSTPLCLWKSGWKYRFLPENGRIIGYRISPDLVIHSRVQYNVNPPVLNGYIRRLGGKLLTPDDVLTLLDNWQDVSALRVKAGDEPLGKFQFWCSSEEGLPVCSKLQDGQIFLENRIGFAKFDAPLILKR